MMISLFLTLLVSCELMPECMILISFLLIPLIWQGSNIMKLMSLSLMIDNVSLSLIVLTIWLTMMMLYLSPKKNKNLIDQLILALSLTLVCFFMSSEMINFYIFYELSIIPTMMIILGWGYQPERYQASFYFFFYTVFASLPFVAGILWGNLTFIYSLNYHWCNPIIQWVMILSFLVKLPLFLFHFWLPKAHVEAPLVGSMILAGVLLKMGGYGLIRLESIFCSYYLISLISSIALVGMIYSSILCLIQMDMKSMIAISSISHMNFMIVGLLMEKKFSDSGSLLMMISHGLVSSALFILCNELFYQTNSRSLLINKFIGLSSPSLLLFWFIFLSLNLSVPPSLGMVSELLISIVVINNFNFMAFYMGMYFFFSAFYSMYLFVTLNHGNTFSMNVFKSLSLKSLMILFGHLTPLFILLVNLNLFF